MIALHVQMPADERGAKQLGRGHAASHLFQLALVLVLGTLVMAEPWPTTGQWRAVFGGFGIVYALQASSDHHFCPDATQSSHYLCSFSRGSSILDTSMRSKSGRTVVSNEPVLMQATKLIMDHMCKEPFEILWWPVLALVLLLANSRAQLLDSAITAWGFAALMIVGYLLYITSIINEICSFLGIRCLAIKPSTA